MSCLPIATQAEAEAGTSNDTMMTPLRTKEAIDALGVSQTVFANALAEKVDLDGTENIRLITEASNPKAYNIFLQSVADGKQVDGIYGYHEVLGAPSALDQRGLGHRGNVGQIWGWRSAQGNRVLKAALRGAAAGC